jgi:hypothetical protein
MREEDRLENEKWELAKKELDTMPEPQYFETTDLLPIKGYSVRFYYGKTNKVVIFNNKLSRAYERDLGVSEVSYKTAKKIFNS